MSRHRKPKPRVTGAKALLLAKKKRKLLSLWNKIARGESESIVLQRRLTESNRKVDQLRLEARTLRAEISLLTKGVKARHPKGKKK